MPATAVPLRDDSRFVLLRAPAPEGDFAHDVRTGLSAARKWLPPRWFYDDLGSSLFDTICFLPEYYVMRAEAEIFQRHRAEIAGSFGPDVRLVELGSGAARKTRLLLDILTQKQSALEYVPVDIDAAMLERSGAELLREYPTLRVTAIRSDFSHPSIPLGMLTPAKGRTVVLFLGSTIGNLSPTEAVTMLRDLRTSLKPGDAFLLGADLRKDRAILEPAYDDALGVTAAFNLNLLLRINRELGGDFDLRDFRHQAFYDEAHGKIEMHLVSTREQTVAIGQLQMEVWFAESETIHTESSYKHDATTLATLAEASGFTIEQTWTDAKGWFADVLMIAG